VGVSVDVVNTLEVFAEKNQVKHLLLSDFGRKMLPAYDALITDQQSPAYWYGKRAYFIIDRQGIVRYMKVMDNPLDILQPEEVLKALKESGVS
jgi:peroxiredoxin